MKRKTEAQSQEDAIVGALQADLIRYELWVLETIAKTPYRVNYLKQSPSVRPVYVQKRMDNAVAGILNDPSSTEETKRAARIGTYFDSLWVELTRNKPSWRFAQIMSAFSDAIPTPPRRAFMFCKLGDGAT